MDQKELQEKIALYYSKLPPNVQALFSSMAWLETLKTISRKYNLNDKQTETLGTETTLVLLGIIHLVEYEEILTKELELSASVTDKLFMEIEASIIQTVRPQLVQAYEANKKSEEEANEPKSAKIAKDPLEKLPKEIKKIVEESNYQATLYEITKERKLTVEQMGVVETAVINLIDGSMRPEEFESYLESKLKMPQEEIEKLANDIKEKIFLKIRELLKSTKGAERAGDIKVLNSTGINIVPDLPAMPGAQQIQTEKLELAAGDKPIENREELLKSIEEPTEGIPPFLKKESNDQPHPVRSRARDEIASPSDRGAATSNGTHSILAQKLSGSFQISSAKTDHTLENITKPSGETKTPTPPTRKIDPYREIPE